MLSITNFIQRKFGHLTFYRSLVQASHLVSAQIFIQILGVVAFMVYSYLFPPNEFGLISLFYSFASIILALATFYIHDTVSRYYYEERNDFPHYITSSLLMVAVLSLVVAILTIISRNWIFGTLIKNFSVRLLPALFVYAASTFFYIFLINIWAAKRETKKVAVANIIYNYGKFAVGVICVLLVVNKIPSTSRIIGESFAVAIIGIYCLILILKSAEKKVSKQTLNEHFNYASKLAIPFLFLYFSEMILGAFDQWFINNYYGNYDTGIYSFGYKIGALLIGVSQALMLSNNNDYYENMNAADYHKVAYQTRTLLKFIALACIGLMFFSNDAVGILARREAYFAAIPIVKIVSLGCFFQAMYSLYARNFIYAKKAFYLTYLLLLTGGLNIVLNYIFIPKFGYIAAAYTTLASYIIGYLAIHFVEHKLFSYRNIRLDYNLLTILITLGCFAISFPLSTWWGWGAFFLKILIYISVFIILFGDRIKEFVFSKPSN